MRHLPRRQPYAAVPVVLARGRFDRVSAFDDIRDYVAIPRVLSLKLAPDGSRLVSAVQTLNPDGKSYGTALWDIPLDGEPYRLTRSAKGETAAEFTADGDLLFTSARPDPTVKDADGEVPALWLLPRAGGEARAGRHQARRHRRLPYGGRRVVFASDVLAGDEATEEERRKARKDAGISAILHEGYPVRYWDHDLGPGHVRLFAARLGDDRLEEVRELTPIPARRCARPPSRSPRTAPPCVATWRCPLPAGEQRTELVAIDVASGPRRTLFGAGRARLRRSARGLPRRAPGRLRPERHAAAEATPAELDLWIGRPGHGRGHAAAASCSRRTSPGRPTPGRST